MKTIIPPSIKRLTKSALVFAWIAALSPLSQADTIWTGAVNNNWNTAGNWSTGAKPDYNQLVRISSSGADVTMSASGFASTVTVSGTGTAPVLTISQSLSLNGGTLNVGSWSVSSSGMGGTVYQVSGLVRPQFTNDLTLNVASLLRSGEAATGNTGTYVFGGASVNAPVFTSGSAGRVNVAARAGEKGTLSLKDYGTFTVSGSIFLAQINGEGILEVEGGHLSINVGGLSLNASGAGKATYRAIFTNSGISTINVNSSVSFGQNTTFELALGPDFETHPGEVFTLFSAVNGFAGQGRFSNVLEGAILSNGNYQFEASYLNNAFTLTTLAIPEPSQFALLFFGAAALILLPRRRSLCGKRG